MTVKESELQKAIAAYLDSLMEQGALFWQHSPNEGKRSPRRGASLKAQGMKAGFPDVAIYPPLPERPYFIELKVHGNYLQKNQKEVQKQLEALGYRYHVVKAKHSYDAVQQVRQIVHHERTGGYADG